MARTTTRHIRDGARRIRKERGAPRYVTCGAVLCHMRAATPGKRIHGRSGAIGGRKKRRDGRSSFAAGWRYVTVCGIFRLVCCGYFSRQAGKVTRIVSSVHGANAVPEPEESEGQ
ncbi:MAG: hypothetical protein ACKV2V_08060 [Blastocatellia bacterium]